MNVFANHSELVLSSTHHMFSSNTNVVIVWQYMMAFLFIRLLHCFYMKNNNVLVFSRILANYRQLFSVSRFA